MSSADRVGHYYVEEATPGVLPNSAAFKALRITGESLKANFQFDQSKELREDRTEPEQVIIASNVSGDANFELLWDGQDDFMAAVCGQDAWTAAGAGVKTLKNGVAGKSFSILKRFKDLADVNHLFTGMYVNTWNLNVQKKSIITGSFGLIGMLSTNGQLATVTTGAPTYAAASATDPMNGSSHLKGIKMDGVSMTSAVDKASISMMNNYKAEERLGSLAPTGYTQGRIQVTGTMDIYFKTEVEYNKYKAGTPWAFELDFEDNDGNELVYLFDRCKFEDMEIVAGGTNQDVIAKGKWRALYDPANNRVFQITSTAA